MAACVLLLFPCEAQMLMCLLWVSLAPQVLHGCSREEAAGKPPLWTRSAPPAPALHLHGCLPELEQERAPPKQRGD